MEKRYSDPTSDATRIAGEVVALGHGTGWFGDVRIAAAGEAKLGPFSIGLRGAVWVPMPGGTARLYGESAGDSRPTAVDSSNGRGR